MALYQPKDSQYWWVSIVNPRTSQRIRKSTKLTDKSLARLFEEQLTASLVLGEQHYSLQSKANNPTWKHACERWLKETQHKKDHINDKTKVEWLLPHLGTCRLSELNSSLIQKVADQKAGQTSQATANRLLTLIRSILNRAYKQWGWLDKVPHIRLYKEPTRRIRYLTKDEAKALLAQLPPHLRDMTLFSLHTGLRASNVTGLTWSQVNLKQHHLAVYADQTKAGKALSVPLSSEVIAILERQQGKHPTHVFTFKGHPVLQPNTAAWRKALKRAGLEDFRWHDLRHTWATWHIQAGTPLHVLQELGGWSSYEMVRRYAHLTSDYLKKFTITMQL